MSTIAVDRKVMTLINTFEVDPADAERLAGLLHDIVLSVMMARPGFISSNLHIAEDRTKVINYAQWASKADYLAMLADPQVQVELRKSGQIATGIRPVICDLVYVDEAG